jgi:hypothetical protein
MPPKKKAGAGDVDAEMKAARFGRVKNTLAMGFGMYTGTFDAICFLCASFPVLLTNDSVFLFLYSFRTVGLPNVGKSSLTNLLSGANRAEVANYVRAHLTFSVSRKQGRKTDNSPIPFLFLSL